MTMELATCAKTQIANVEEQARVDAAGYAHEAMVVAGYTLEHRLGSGGYGEVWRAVGPGGLPKAVKILHGMHDGREAETELKALEKMRDLRHPFLLSIERIEIVDGKLVIVSELAEASLEDRFHQYTQEGRKGIPRDELLTYLRDAADALDFMYEGHGLQHLDIKPGNLLIQGGHVKVADFGLIKDLKQSYASIIGGFTPLYAPPELFEGRPAHNSDQYSLAIVYQILLTGEPPFAGRTAAQLMSQHINSEPDLSTLLPSDRPAVSKALSKSSAARFANCRQFIDQLLSRKATKGASRRTSNGSTARKTDALSDLDQSTQNLVPKQDSRPLPPVTLTGKPAECRPTLFIGLGGVGGKILCQLRSEFGTQFGVETQLPSLRMLHIDTDPEALKDSQRISSGLSKTETLAIPLRDTKSYRAASRELLEWLSRRWLYNIPRSRLPERMRPLGRLALVDHHEAIRQRLTACVEQGRSEEALRETGEATQLTFKGDGLNVVVFASTSGGTGSGAVLDFGYLVRDVLATAGVRQCTLTAHLIHTNDARPQANRLERANTIAFLNEFERFSDPAIGYPGDHSCDLPSTSEPPFDVTYLVSIGQTAHSSFEQQTASVAEYVYRSTVTAEREFFDACRADHSEGPGTFRTFGVGMLNEAAQQDAEREAAGLCRALIQRWYDNFDGQAPSPLVNDGELQERTKKLLAAFELETPKLVGKVSTVLRGKLATMVDEYFDAIYAEASGSAANPLEFLSNLDEEFKPSENPAEEDAHPRNVIRLLTEQLARTAQQSTKKLQQEITAIVNSTEQRFEGCRVVLETVISNIAAISQELSPLSSQIEGDMEKLRGQAVAARTEKELQKLGKSYWKLKFCESVYRCLDDYLLHMRRTAREAADRLSSYGPALHESAKAFARLIDASAHKGDYDGCANLVPLAAAFDEYLRTCDQFTVIDLFSNDGQDSHRLFMELRRAAFEFLSTASHHTDSPDSQDSLSSQFGSVLMENARPHLSKVGGGHRVLALIPPSEMEREWRRRLGRTFGNCVTMTRWNGQSVWACCEVENLKPDSLRGWMSGGDVSLIETADRVHTRIDVEWD